jgi:hypothetical protein
MLEGMSKLKQLSIFDVTFDATADRLIKELDVELDKLNVSLEQKKTVYLQIIWRVLASELHPNTTAATLKNLLSNQLRHD